LSTRSSTPLTHEAAYQGLLQDRKRALHRATEQAERLAHHALRAELWEKAVAYLRQAGLRAFARGANQEAVAHLDQALVALRRLPKTRESTELTIDIHIDIRNALLGGGYARIGDHLREAEVLARSLGDKRRLGRITTFMVTQRLAAGDYDGAVRFGEVALALGSAVPESPEAGVHSSVRGDDFQPGGSARPPAMPEKRWNSPAGWALGATKRTLSASAVTSPRKAAPRTWQPIIARHSRSPSPAACARSSHLPPRSRQALSPHGHAWAGLGAHHHRDGDVPRNGHAVLVEAGGGRDASAGIGVALDLHGPRHRLSGIEKCAGGDE
jgi:hypothetical protein